MKRDGCSRVDFLLVFSSEMLLFIEAGVSLSR